MRTSRIAALTSASLSLPLPDSFLNAFCSLSVKPSNAMRAHLSICNMLVRRRRAASVSPSSSAVRQAAASWVMAR